MVRTVLNEFRVLGMVKVDVYLSVLFLQTEKKTGRFNYLKAILRLDMIGMSGN